MNSNDIKKARQELGLSQRQLASLLGIAGDDPATVGAWEIGRRQPSGPICAHIETLLQIHLAGLTIPRMDAAGYNPRSKAAE